MCLEFRSWFCWAWLLRTTLPPAQWSLPITTMYWCSFQKSLAAMTTCELFLTLEMSLKERYIESLHWIYWNFSVLKFCWRFVTVQILASSCGCGIWFPFEQCLSLFGECYYQLHNAAKVVRWPLVLSSTLRISSKQFLQVHVSFNHLMGQLYILDHW